MQSLPDRRPPTQPQLRSVRIVMLLFAMLALLLLVTSCAGIGHSDASNCAGWAPIVGEAQDLDVMSDTLALSIRAHNGHWYEVCE